MMDTIVGAWRRWRGRLSIGVLDQATLSGGNFLFNVLLARWLPPSGYGAFAIAFATLLLLGGPHAALLIDPLSAVGPRRFFDRRREYIRTVVILHALLTVPIAILLAASARWIGPLVKVPADQIVALAIAVPLVLLMWLLRSACYLAMRPLLALTGSVVYVTGLLGFLIVAHRTPLSANAGLTIMSAAAAIAAIVVAISLGIVAAPPSPIAIGAVAREHWPYGRWILGASAAHGVANGLYVPLVGALIGVEHSAVLRALQNLVLPLQQALTGVMMVAYPFISRQVAEHGIGYLRRRGPVFVMLSVGAASAYGAVIAVLGQPLLTLLYGSGYYSSFASLVPLFALTAILAALAQCLGILARVVNRPQHVLWAKLAAAAWLGAVGIFLVRTAGVKGAVLSLAGGTLVEAAVLALAMKSARAGESAPWHAEDVL